MEEEEDGEEDKQQEGRDTEDTDKEEAQEVLEADPTLGRPEHLALRESLETALKARSNWVRIS